MDSTILVESQFEEGKKLIEMLDEAGSKFPIVTWINFDENGWTLLFAIPNLRTLGAKTLFKKIHEIIVRNNLKLSLNNISLIDNSNDLCKNLRTMIKTGYSLGRISMSGSIINNQRIPEVVIYRVN